MSKNLDDLFTDLFGKSDRPRPESPERSRRYPGQAGAAGEALGRAETLHRDMGAQLQSQLDELRKMTSQLDLERIEREVERDFGPLAKADGGEPRPPAGLEGFADLLPLLQREVLGQDAFLKRLIIAFKRPFVAGYPEAGAKNTLFIHGSPASGRHSAVDAIAGALHARGVLASPKVQRMDLGLYPTQGEERLFLQDLFRVLKGEGEVVVFDRYAACHPGLLGQLADLVIHGRLHLSSRYVLQKGRLIDAGSALTSDTVDALYPEGKYLVLIDEKGPDRLAERFGAAFVDALGDLCATGDFSDESLDAIARSKFDALRARAAERLGFELTCQAPFFTLLSEKYTAEQGVGGMVRFCDLIFKALAQYKLEHDAAPRPVELQAREGRVEACLDSAHCDLLALLPGQYQGELEAVKAEMDKVVGLREVKAYIFSLEDHYKVQAMRRAEGMKTAPVSMHMIFTGNPGTGKTTVARLIAKYLKAIGVLSGGQLIEVSRADLVGKYVGHTAPLTQQVIKSAIGGVLFIDEAYSLYRGEQDSFGLEAIDTLVKGMEDNRDNLLVVLAGYSREMAEFMTANSGLRSRFPNIIEFPDYTGEQLREIANLQAHGKGYIIEEQAQAPLLDYFNIIQAMDSRESGNGRLARNVVEKAIIDQSRRIVAQADKLNMLRLKDFDLFENPAEPEVND